MNDAQELKSGPLKIFYCVVLALLLASCAPPVEEWIEVEGQRCLRYQEYMGGKVHVLCPRETP